MCMNYMEIENHPEDTEGVEIDLYQDETENKDANTEEQTEKQDVQKEETKDNTKADDVDIDKIIEEKVQQKLAEMQKQTFPQTDYVTPDPAEIEQQIFQTRYQEAYEKYKALYGEFTDDEEKIKRIAAMEAQRETQRDLAILNAYQQTTAEIQKLHDPQYQMIVQLEQYAPGITQAIENNDAIGAVMSLLAAANNFQIPERQIDKMTGANVGRNLPDTSPINQAAEKFFKTFGIKHDAAKQAYFAKLKLLKGGR